jgi:histidyl-tRNA synthetase
MPDQDDVFRAPRGTRDLLPPESWDWNELTRLALDQFALAGYAPVETPTFEHTEVFERGVGEASEVVNKQMYTFTDLGGRSLTLRPEGTAPVIRAVLEHRLDKGPLPVKLSYASMMYRQERPQKGRYRQFLQLGIEAIGSDSPSLDAEVVEMGMRYLRAAGVNPRLLLNSIGHLDESCRGAYLKLLVGFLDDHRDELDREDVGRIETNPLRTFDSKQERTMKVMESAPLITDHLCDECEGHFAEVRSLLDSLEVSYELEPRLVRGLDYYTRTAFEYVAGQLGAQNAVGGGGRYDGLAEALGSDRLPGIGFALGLDRIALARNSDGGAPAKVAVYIVAQGESAGEASLTLATRLRAAGIGAELDHGGRSMKGQMKDADRSGARFAAIIGDEEISANEVTLRDLESGEQERVPLESVLERVRR